MSAGFEPLQDRIQHGLSEHAATEAKEDSGQLTLATQAEEETRKKREIQPAIAKLIRADARNAAELLASKGVQPPPQTDTWGKAKYYWVLGISEREIKTKTDGVSHEHGDPMYTTASTVQRYSKRGIALLATGELICVKDADIDYQGDLIRPVIGGRRSGYQPSLHDALVNNDDVVSLSSVDLGKIAEEQDIIANWRSQLESLVVHALTDTMSAYTPHWNSITDPCDADQLDAGYEIF